MEYIKGFFTAADNAFILQDGPPAEAFSERSAWLKSQDAVIDRVVADVIQSIRDMQSGKRNSTSEKTLSAIYSILKQHKNMQN